MARHRDRRARHLCITPKYNSFGDDPLDRADTGAELSNSNCTRSPKREGPKATSVNSKARSSPKVEDLLTNFSLGSSLGAKNYSSRDH
jgi:hypothetical protein